MAENQENKELQETQQPVVEGQNPEDEYVEKEPDLIVITKVKTFWLEPLLNYLEENNVVIETLEMEEIYLSTDYVTTKYVFIQAEDFEDKNAGFLKKLSDFCTVNGIKLIVYGTSEGVNELRKKLHDSLIALALERPGETKIIGKRIISKVLDTEISTTLKRKSILAVDDAGFMLRTIKGWLEEDYDVYLANSASKAMTMLNNPKPDLILLDYEMPVCSGAQFFAMLKDDEGTASIPVIFLTAKDDRETVTEVLNLHPAGYVLKTTTKAQLIAKMEEALAKTEENA